jgi:hypothetical protein
MISGSLRKENPDGCPKERSRCFVVGRTKLPNLGDELFDPAETSTTYRSLRNELKSAFKLVEPRRISRSKVAWNWGRYTNHSLNLACLCITVEDYAMNVDFPESRLFDMTQKT